jgi:hypothetical protein
MGKKKLSSYYKTRTNKLMQRGFREESTEEDIEPRRDEVRSEKEYITRSFMLCTPH